MSSAKLRVRLDTVMGLNAVKGWLRVLNVHERAAVFGAIEDEWCIQCGKEGHSGPCAVPQPASGSQASNLKRKH